MWRKLIGRRLIRKVVSVKTETIWRCVKGGGDDLPVMKIPSYPAIWLMYRRIFKIILLTHQGMILWGDRLAGISYPGEIDSPEDHKPGRLTSRGIIPRGDWLAAVSYSTDDRKIWITRWILNQNRKYFNPLVSGPGRFELWREKKLEVENLVGLSL